MQKEQRLSQKIVELQQQWDLLSDKLSRLRQESIIESNHKLKFILDKQIAELQAERYRIEQQLNQLESQTTLKYGDREAAMEPYSIEFVNRWSEIRYITNTYCPPYLLIDAPAGYGKTRLVEIVKERLQQRNWLCIHLKLSREKSYSIQELNTEILQQLEEDSPEYSNVTTHREIGDEISHILLRTLRYSPRDILLLIDEAEALDELLILELLNQYIPAVKAGLDVADRSIEFRLICAGRYIFHWSSLASKLQLVPMSLSPFNFPVVYQTVEHFVATSNKKISSEYSQNFASHLMYFTGGHPGCMASILRRIYGSPMEFSYENEYHETIVRPVIEEIRNHLPSHLKEVFDTLSVVRCFDSQLLGWFIDKGLITWPRDKYDLEFAVSQTYNRKQDSLTDDITRRLLAIRLRKTDLNCFIKICKESISFYIDSLKNSESFRADFIVIELLYQQLRVLFYKQHGNKEQFFEILNQSLGLLILQLGHNSQEIIESIIELLKDDWEFQFTLNYLLKDGIYNDSPFRELVERIQEKGFETKFPSEEVVEKPLELTQRNIYVQKFLDNAGFAIKTVSDTGDFIAMPRISLWKERFHEGIYVPAGFDTPLDNEAVNSIFQKAKKYTVHALVITKQQPKLDGWMAISSLQLNAQHPFVLIPIADNVINESLLSLNEHRTFADHIEKYIGKGYDPYNVRDPVFDALSFFGREGIMDEILNELKSGNRIGLFGLHKIGKSSLLKALQKKAAFPVSYVYLEKGISLHDIYKNILSAWEHDIRFKFPNFKWDNKTLHIDSDISFKSKAQNLLERLKNVSFLPHLSVFLDEIETIIPYQEGDEEALNRYVSLMDSLRGLQQETESLSLLVAGVHPTLARVNYFWGSQKNPMHQVIVEKFLPPLEQDDCEVMVRSLGKQIGLDYDDETMEFILRKSGAHPYLARQFCSAAYQKHKEVGVMQFEVVKEAAEEFVYNPSRNDYFNDNALWGELAKENLWGKEIGQINHQILLKLVACEEGLSKVDLSQGISRVIFEQSFAILKERSIISLIPESDRYQITFELFQDWIQAHKLNRKEMSWQTHSISEHLFPTTNLSDVGIK